MGKAISLRLDEESFRALQRLEAAGFTRSEAVRRALVETAARLRAGRGLRAEARALEADDEDRAEMLGVAALLESLRAPR